jgi:hypothetical protein
VERLSAFLNLPRHTQGGAYRFAVKLTIGLGMFNAFGVGASGTTAILMLKRYLPGQDFLVS